MEGFKPSYQDPLVYSVENLNHHRSSHFKLPNPGLVLDYSRVSEAFLSRK
jgi:hypothetical protein